MSERHAVYDKLRAVSALRPTDSLHQQISDLENFTSFLIRDCRETITGFIQCTQLLEERRVRAARTSNRALIKNYMYVQASEGGDRRRFARRL